MIFASPVAEFESMELDSPDDLGSNDDPAGKKSSCSTGDTGDMDLISGSRRSPGEGSGNPFQ